MSLRYLLSPSGGLTYHLIARRRSRTLWRSFRATVRSWLRPWIAKAGSSLIVFGPSAGWTLPLEDFAAFESLLFVEPDPLARFLLRRRLSACGVSPARVSFSSRSDLLPWSSPRPGTFATFLSEHPASSVLFANVLGQVVLHAPSSSPSSSSAADGARIEFLAALKDRPWASYHDLFSGSSRDFRPLKRDRASPEQLANAHDAIASTVFTHGDVIDHETTWLSSDQDTSLALWPLTEGSLHLIGFVATP